MKKDSLATEVNETKDHLLNLSTQSQEDEQVFIQRNSASVATYHHKNHLAFMQENECEEEYDFTSKTTTTSESKNTAILGVKNTTSKKQKLSLVLNEITRAAGSRSKTAIITEEQQKQQKQTLQKRWVTDQEDQGRILNQIDDDLSLNNRLRKSSIVSIYCKKNDITFVSSPEEFALKVMNSNSNMDEENPHLSQLQIELIISNKDGEDDSLNHTSSKQQQQPHQSLQQIPPQKKNSLSDLQERSRKNSFSVKEILQNQNAISEREIPFEENVIKIIEDDEYDVLISSPSNNSLSKAIETHTNLMNQYENEQEKEQKYSSLTDSKMNAYDLLLFLQKDISDY